MNYKADIPQLLNPNNTHLCINNDFYQLQELFQKLVIISYHKLYNYQPKPNKSNIHLHITNRLDYHHQNNCLYTHISVLLTIKFYAFQFNHMKYNMLNYINMFDKNLYIIDNKYLSIYQSNCQYMGKNLETLEGQCDIMYDHIISNLIM